MIIYETGEWGLGFICSLRGSTIPKATFFSIPSAIIAAGWRILLTVYEVELAFMQTWTSNVLWSVTMVVLSMLLGFRTNKAYSRFWEGITLVNQMSAEWFEACSNLTAFSKAASSMSPEDMDIRRRVRIFQYTLVRLMSLMHGTALRQIGGYSEEFVVLDVQALDDESMRYLYEFCAKQHINRVEVLLHWIQVLITEGISNKLLVVPPPILTRAFQTLSRGMVNLNNARKLADVPFPFPLSQINVVLILMQAVLTPFYVAALVDDVAMATILTFIPMFGMWSITFISCQLEQPFGQDPNDLPLANLQASFNASLCMLLDPVAQRAPCLRANACQKVNLLRQHTAGRASTTDSFKNDINCRKSKGTWDAALHEDDDEDEALYQTADDFGDSSPRARTMDPSIHGIEAAALAEVESVRSKQSKISSQLMSVPEKEESPLSSIKGNDENASPRPPGPAIVPPDPSKADVVNARNMVPYLQLDPSRAPDAQEISMHFAPNAANLAGAALTESTEASPTPLQPMAPNPANTAGAYMFAPTGPMAPNPANTAGADMMLPAAPPPPKPGSQPASQRSAAPASHRSGGSQRGQGVSASAATAAEIALSAAMRQDASTQVSSSRVGPGGENGSQRGLTSHRSLQSAGSNSRLLRRGSSALGATPEEAVAASAGTQTTARTMASSGQASLPQPQARTPPSPAGSAATAVNSQTQANQLSNRTALSSDRSLGRASAGASGGGSVAGETAPTPNVPVPTPSASIPMETPAFVEPAVLPQPFPTEPVYRPARLNQLSSRAHATARAPGLGQGPFPSQAAPRTIAEEPAAPAGALSPSVRMMQAASWRASSNMQPGPS